MERIIVFLFDKVLATFLKVTGMVLVFSILLQIFSRIAMTHPFSWTEELSRFAFVWFCFLGSAYTLRMKLHLGIDYLYQKFGQRMRRVLDFIIQGLILFFGGLMLYTGLLMVKVTAIQRSPILRLPMSYIYVVLPICGFYIVVFSIYQLSLLARPGVVR
jgi:TRAP-type transport system small permease protein